MVIDEEVSSPACTGYDHLGGEHRTLYEKSKVLSEHTWRLGVDYSSSNLGLKRDVVTRPVIFKTVTRISLRKFSWYTMADMDVFAAMGIAGFGKASKKKELDPARFDKNKRSSGVVCFLLLPQPRL